MPSRKVSWRGGHHASRSAGSRGAARRAPADARAGRARRTRGRRTARRSSPPPAAASVPGRASSACGRCAPRTTRGSRGTARPAWIRRPCACPCPRRPRGSCSGTAAPGHARARPRRCPPTSRPWRSACCAVGGVGRAPFADGSGTAAVSPIAQMFSWPFTRSVGSTSIRPLVRRAAGRARARAAAARRPAVQQTVRVGMRSPGGERRGVLLHGVEARAGADLDSAAAQLGGGELGQARADLGHDPVEPLDQDPARAVDPAARIAVDHVGDHVLQLGDPLDARVARADEHERQVLAPLLRVVDRLGDLQVQQRAVAQRDRLGQRLEADRVLGEPGDGQRARHRAEREHELVVAQCAPRGRRACTSGARSARGRGRAPSRAGRPPSRAPRAAGRRRGVARACPAAAPGRSGV